MPVTEFTRTLAEFVASTTAADIDNDVRARASASIEDCAAVMLAGRASDAGAVIIRYARDALLPGAASGPCWAVGLPGGCPGEVAALVNATCAHGLDYDDAIPGGGHLSALVLPAVVATAESVGIRLDGEKLIESFVVGVEVGAKVAKALGVAHYFKGWHTTSTAGSFGAAAAACKLLGSDADQTAAALGVTGSLASGLQLNFGTATKALHCGLAARNGVMAAQLADRGFTAAPAILDGPQGFLEVYGDGGSHPEELELLGRPWSLAEPGATLKRYPCCYAAARSASAALQLAETHNYDPADITAVISKVPKGALQALVCDRPETGLHGKSSMQYVLAAALIDHELELATFTDDAVRRPEIRELMAKVSSLEDSSLRPEDPEALVSSPTMGGYVELTIETRGGDRHTLTVSEPPGGPRRPLTDVELQSKWLACARFGEFDELTVHQVLPRLASVATATDFPSLLRALTGGPPGTVTGG